MATNQAVPTISKPVRDGRGPASHVTVDVIDPRGRTTPVSQALQQLAAQRRPLAAATPTLLVTGIVVGATVISAGIESWSPTFAALALAGLVVFSGRLVEHRARRTDRNTTWASRSGQAFGAWAPAAPAGQSRLLIDQRGLAVADLTTKRRPHAVLLWRSVVRIVIVPGRERRTVTGLVAHLNDGNVAVFTTSLNTHEVVAGLVAVGVLTDLQQAMTASGPVRRLPAAALAAGPEPVQPSPAQAPPPAPLATVPEAWARVSTPAAPTLRPTTPQPVG